MSYPPQYPQSGQPSFYGEPPLWAPYYGASLPVAFRRFWLKYAAFSGRASRSEYWWWMLISVGVVIAVEILMAIAGIAGASTTAYGTTPGPGAGLLGILLILWGLATVVPGLALGVRRLHDANLSGLLLLLALIPFLGGIAVLVMTLLPSNPQGQRFDRPTGPAARPFPGRY